MKGGYTMKKYEKSKRIKYFRKQRAYGWALILLSILSIRVSGGDITAAILFAPAGVYLLFSKEMWVLDDYYYEVEARKEEES